MPSSVVATFHYDNVTHTLRVVYVSGAVYDYLGVPEKIYKAMRSSGSKGVYLNRYIKPKYNFLKISD